MERYSPAERRKSKGNGKLIDFDINMKSEPKTAIYLDFMNNNSATDYDFITFVDKKQVGR